MTTCTPQALDKLKEMEELGLDRQDVWAPVGWHDSASVCQVQITGDVFMEVVYSAGFTKVIAICDGQFCVRLFKDRV